MHHTFRTTFSSFTIQLSPGQHLGRSKINRIRHLFHLITSILFINSICIASTSLCNSGKMCMCVNSDTYSVVLFHNIWCSFNFWKQRNHLKPETLSPSTGSSRRAPGSRCRGSRCYRSLGPSEPAGRTGMAAALTGLWSATTQTAPAGKWSTRLRGRQGSSSSHHPLIPATRDARLAHVNRSSLEETKRKGIFYLKNPRPHERCGAILPHRVIVAHKLQKNTQ